MVFLFKFNIFPGLFRIQQTLLTIMAEKRPDYSRYLGNIFDSTIARKWKWCRYFGGVHFQMKIIKVQIRAEIVSVITSIELLKL